ncbi:MAG TPA: molybdate ABC transporter permease subunit [Aestuariivirgaceae bacterium]|nr:molybdate ABC transporter permease subunit [Aestuariivirgaceae bacterium]
MQEWTAVKVTLELAAATVAVLLVLGTPLAYWLAFTKTRLQPIIEALVALPLVLPPTVLGFYLLLLFGPQNPVGSLWLTVTGTTLAFSFTGLVVASVIYSLPFVVQPLQQAFMEMGRGPLEAAATLGAGPSDAFFSVAAPLARRGFITATVLGFAHTMGEFGVVLMVGGNIPGETRLISIAIYESVETLNYREAHILSLGLLAFSFLVLVGVFLLNRGLPVASRRT